jgi:type IV secretory pathway ATPase VirB11/archaellum biosynthesis ATPase
MAESTQKQALSQDKDFEYEVERDGDLVGIRVNYENVPRIPSLEDDPLCMAKTIDLLNKVKDATHIVFYQKRDYEYDYDQIILLHDIARMFSELSKRKDLFSYNALNFHPACEKFRKDWYNEIQSLIFEKIKNDPIGAYVHLRRLIRQEKIKQQRIVNDTEARCVESYLSLLMYIYDLFEKTRLITVAKPYLDGYRIGDREIYQRFFHPIIRPDFMFTKLMATYPEKGIEIDNFMLSNDTEVTIFKFEESAQYLYHLMPPEFQLDEDKYEILDKARQIMAEHKPEQSEFVDPDRMRQVFFNVGYDLIQELANYQSLQLPTKELEDLTNILVRYTVGFGLIEILLLDEEMQDISINSPYGENPIYIVHGKYDDCITNIIPTSFEAENWATKLRLISGRPLDESNPLLDTEIELPGASVRTSTITKPLSPSGLSFSFRKHREKPWTIPLFIKNKMINTTAAGVLSFLVDGTRTFFIAGTRSSGKTSFLTGLMVEISRRNRVVTVEDTLELPFNPLRKLGYNIVSMKVASALAENSNEYNASQGVRSTLRLGDSSLVVGEVRSKEAIAVFEAMRVGAGANVVAGTFHADSPYGIYDRVVNALGIPNTSFKALDIAIIANPIRSADGLHKKRRVTQITEVRKLWEQDPMTEKGFVDLMRYNSETDELEVTDDLKNGDSDVLKSIAANIPEFAGDWDALWHNILLRGRTKELLVEYSESYKDPDMLEAEFVIRANDRFHNIIEEIKEGLGELDRNRILTQYETWIKHEAEKRRIDRKKSLD